MTNYAIIGKQRAGKDTLAEYLQKKHGGQILKFADPLYEIQQAIYEIVELPIHNSKDRLLLQWIGTEWGRKTINPNIWVNIMDRRLTKILSKEEILSQHSLFMDYQPLNLYITDARFPNEIELLRKHDFKIIKVETCEQLRINRGATNLYHESETALDGYNDYDAIIDNTNDLETFYQNIDYMYEKLQK